VFQVAQYFNDKPRKKFIDFGEILKRTVVSSDDNPAPPVKLDLADPSPSMKPIKKQATAGLNSKFTDNPWSSKRESEKLYIPATASR
jgi:hypothetical protein